MRRAQTYTLDLALGTTILLVVLTGVLLLTVGGGGSPQTQRDAHQLAGVLYSPVPLDWQDADVILPGFVDKHRLDTTLADRFFALPEERIQDLAGIQSNVTVRVLNSTGTLYALGTVSPDANDVHIVRRHAAHQGEIIRIEVIAWR